MRIGVDMDGVLANFTGSALENIRDVWGIDLEYEDIVIPRMGDLVHSKMSEYQKIRYKCPRDLYNQISPPGFFEELEPYPGAIETLKELHEDHDVVIVTKPLEWNHCPGEKYTWLNKHLGFKPKLLLASSMEAKGLVDVDVMVDDDPRVIKSLYGTMGIMVEHPWNEEFRKFEAVYSVKTFSEVPKAIEDISKAFYDPQIAY